MATAAQAAAAAPAKPKLDAKGRAYATGRRKNATSRVWIKRGTGKITVNGKPIETYFARPVLRMLVQQPLVTANRATRVRRRLHRRRRRPLRPGRRGAPRPVRAHDLFRARTSWRPQEGRLPDPRQPRRSSARSTASPRPAAASSSRSAKRRGTCRPNTGHLRAIAGALSLRPQAFGARMLWSRSFAAKGSMGD